MNSAATRRPETGGRRSRFRNIRIGLLLLLLLLVVHHQVTDRARIASWDDPLWVAVYPIAADGTRRSRDHVAQLDAADLQPIADRMRDEAHRWGVTLRTPIYIELAEPTADAPPAPPLAGNFLQRAWWIARLRWWRWNFDDQGRDPDIIVIARYFDGRGRPTLDHSTGVEGLRIAIANLFADGSMAGANRVVVLHELLHTLGARDKYDPETGLPTFPAGYAEPSRVPLHPQRAAEIMAGRIPVSASEAVQADRLSRVVIGPLSAAEIGWIPFPEEPGRP